MKVMKFLDYIEKKRKDDPSIGQNILSYLPNKVSEEVYNEYFGKVISKIHFLKKFSRQFIQDLSLTFEEKMYGPGEILFQEDEYDECFYYVSSGNIEVMYKN